MKAFYSILLLTLFSLFFTSCGKETEETEGTLALEFKASFNEQPLELFTKYPFQNGEIEFTTVQFYVSNISIEEKNGSRKLALKDVDLLKFTSNSSTLNFPLEEGEYKNLSIGIGLDEELNSSDPASFSTNHPLGINQNNFWIMSQSYIFVKIEGYFYNDVQNNPILFNYHLGDDTFYSLISSNETFSIQKDLSTTLSVLINLNASFDSFLIENKVSTHTVNDEPFAGEMMDDFIKGISIL